MLNPCLSVRVLLSLINVDNWSLSTYWKEKMLGFIGGLNKVDGMYSKVIESEIKPQ